MTAVAACGYLPPLLVSVNLDLEPMLRRCGAPVVRRVAPAVNDAAWTRALARLFTQEVHASGDGAATALVATLQLAPGLCFDLIRGSLLTPEGRETHLTARQAELLAILARTPGRYHHPADLADLLTAPDSHDPVTAQSVMQTISELRQLLGEGARSARLLVHTRRRDYTLALPTKSDASVAVTMEAGAHAEARVSPLV
jgi:DNA-binding response OmpR family regulator